MKKNKQKGFTLIELLVVVAIIGILASVGVVAYNGYTTSAQKSAADSNHNSVVKWIQNEYQKCSIGEDTAMNGNLTCVDGGVAADNDDVAAATITSQRADTAKMNNPYTKAKAVQASGASAPSACSNANRGNIFVTTSGNDVVVTTCKAAADGDTTNLLTDTIALN